MAGRRRPADHRLHAGIGAVRRSGGRSRPHGPHHVRQHPRNRGLVARRRRCRAEDGRPAGSSGRAVAGGAHRHARKRRRHSHLRTRRARCRSRQSAQGPPRRHRADQAAGDDLAAAQHRISDCARARSAPPRGISAHSRSRSTTSRSRRPPRAAQLAIRAVAQWRAIALRHHPRPLRRHRAVPRGRPARWVCARRRRTIRRRCSRRF